MSTPSVEADRQRALLSRMPSQLLVGGVWTPAANGETFAVDNPATGETLCEVADASPEDAHAALNSADAASEGWRRTAPRERSNVLRRAHDLMLSRRDDLALLLTLEMGKPLVESEAEIDYAAGFLRWYSEEAVRINGRFAAAESGVGRILTMRSPVGPCLFITPWNFPVAMGARKVAPALAAGCTCVVKPASQTPLSMLAFADLLCEAGLPSGVVNVVTGQDAAALTHPVMMDPRLRKISFTGSTEVGQALMRQAADQLLRVSMELGGNTPFIVCADADVDAALDGAVAAKMRNGGQACTSANRFLVHESVADGFSKGLAERLAGLTVGSGTDPSVQVGPLIDRTQLTKVELLVTDAVDRGAEVLCGGSRVDGPGCFYQPTVLANVDPGARLLHEEIFGPVAPVTVFTEDLEAVAAANGSVYGLAAYVYTRDLEQAFAIAEALDTGMVALNQGTISNVGAPFGGVKHSGVGREGGPEGIAEYLENKYIALNAGLPPTVSQD